MAVVFHNGSEEEGKKISKPLLDLNALGDTTSMLSYPNLNTMFNQYPGVPNHRHLFGGGNFTFPLDVAAAQEICHQFWVVTNVPESEDLRGSTIAFEYHPTNKVSEVFLGTRLSRTVVNLRQFASICISMNWTDEQKDAEARSLSKRFSQLCAEKVGLKGDKYGDGTSAYANYFSEYCIFGVGIQNLMANVDDQAALPRQKKYMDRTLQD